MPEPATASKLSDDERAELEYLREELAERDDEARERWIQRQLEEAHLRTLDFRNGMAMQIEPARDLVSAWVGTARAMLGRSPNYSETSVLPDDENPDTDPDDPGVRMTVGLAHEVERFVFILQRVAPGALTPHEARQRADREREQAREMALGWKKQLAAAAKECDAIETELHGQHGKNADGARDTVQRIRALLPTPTGQDTDQPPHRHQGGPESTKRAGEGHCKER